MNRKIKFGVLGVSIIILLIVASGIFGVHAANNDGAYRQLGVYSEVLQRVRSEYVEEPNFNAVRIGALHGLLESLDANSSYLSPDEYKRFKERHSDYKAAIGATLSKRFGLAAVVSVVPGGPADKAGLQNGDIIESVEGRNTKDIPLAELRSIVTGEKGSNITFTVLRATKAEPDKITVTRDEVPVPNTEIRELEASIGYIKPGMLTKGKAQEVAAKVKQAQKEGAKKLILDLRNNSEGDFGEAVAVANLFLDHGNITSLKGQTISRQDFNADPSKSIAKLPMVVLVNRGTAGPAEVVAGALLDNQRADVLGDKTFGIGSIQKTIEMSDGAALILSVAKYYTPGGKAIQDNSITPNILVADADLIDTGTPDDDVEQDDNSAAQEQKQAERQRADEQLKRAIAVLKNKNS
jgi:carboxyl-terminal processing protease